MTNMIDGLPVRVRPRLTHYRQYTLRHQRNAAPTARGDFADDSGVLLKATVSMRKPLVLSMDLRVLVCSPHGQ